MLEPSTTRRVGVVVALLSVTLHGADGAEPVPSSGLASATPSPNDEAPSSSPPAGEVALDWCAAWYRSRVPEYGPGEAVPPGTPAPDPSTFRAEALPGVPVTLTYPSTMALRRYDDGAVVELSGGEHRHDRADDAFSDAPVPLLQVRTRPLEGEPSWIGALERAGTLFPATQHVQRRDTTAGGSATEEICVHQIASHGHGTLMDGTHIPMPYEAELARGARWRVGDHLIEVAYRLPQDDVSAWAPVMDRIWRSLQVGPPSTSPAPPPGAP